MPSSVVVPVLVAGMLITGSSNSLWSKYQDMQCVENCSDPDPRAHVLFEQPVWQTLQMFLGEMLCFLPVLTALIHAKFNSRRPANVALPADEDERLDPANKLPTQRLLGPRILLLWLPAACDLTGTTLMNVGLLYTPVSIYQMTRGALVLFVGLLSVLVLGRRLWGFQWASLVTVMAGISLVGLSGSMVRDTVKEHGTDANLDDFAGVVRRALEAREETPEVTKVLLGVFFILFAQVFTATQFVIEEKILSHYTVPPLLAVGYEGLFGVLSILFLLPFFPLLRPAVKPNYSAWFDLGRGWTQIKGSGEVAGSSVAIAFSIAAFNFFGLSLTRRVSATVRSLTDTCRTLCIWIVSLGLGWEKLVWPVSLLQVVGFGLLVYGTFVFNSLLSPPPFLRFHTTTPELLVPEDEERRELLEAVDETERLPAGLGEGRGFGVVNGREEGEGEGEV